jgi:cytoskeletal protein CcmA (bactofilin family)
MFCKITYRLLVALVLAFLALTLSATGVFAAELRTGEIVEVAPGEVIQDDLYAFGTQVVVRGRVEGDVVAAGRSVVLDGVVTGAVWAAGDSVRVSGSVGRSVRVAGREASVGGEVGRDVLMAANDARFEGEAGGDLWAGASTLFSSGSVGGEILGSAATIVLSGPVGEDVTVRVENLRLLPGARVGGRVTYESENVAFIDPSVEVQKGVTAVMPRVPSQVPPLVSERGRIISLLGLSLVGALLALAAPRSVASISSRISERPWATLGYGVLTLIVVPIAGFILGITLVGLPLGILSIVAYAAAMYLAPVFAGHLIGEKVFRRVGRNPHPAWAVILGLLILAVVGRVPILGFLVKLAVIVWVMGSLALPVFSRGRTAVPAMQGPGDASQPSGE